MSEERDETPDAVVKAMDLAREAVQMMALKLREIHGDREDSESYIDGIIFCAVFGTAVERLVYRTVRYMGGPENQEAINTAYMNTQSLIQKHVDGIANIAEANIDATWADTSCKPSSH